MTRSLCPACWQRIAEGEAAGADAPCHRLFRRYRARRGACASQGAGGGHRRSCVPHRQPALPSLRRRDHALALDPGDRAQPRSATASTVGARVCAPPTFRCWRWTIRRPTRARASAKRSPVRSTRTARKRSCSVAPAWRISRPRSSREFGVPVIDGVAAAVVLAEGLRRSALRPRAVAAMRGRCRRTIPAFSRRSRPSD